jgi:hypothetical protein
LGPKEDVLDTMHDMQPATIPLLFTSFLLLSAAASETPRSAAEPTFAIANDRFVLNGTEVSLAGGCVHYFRIHPSLWCRLATGSLKSFHTCWCVWILTNGYITAGAGSK